MNTKSFRQRRYRPNNDNPNRQRPEKKPAKQPQEKIVSNLIQQFNFWCVSLRTKATFEFNRDENAHQCKMTLPIFPNFQSIGNGAKTKKEAKANAIVAFLAHLEKRKQVGLFVPYVIPNLFRDVQVELRRATVSTPDPNLNSSEYLLTDRIIPKRQAKKSENMMKLLEKICHVRIITLWQSSNMTFVYIVGPKSQEESIHPYATALFQPETGQMFDYGEKLFDVFNDETFLVDVCQRLKVLCDNHLETCKLFIRGSSVNVRYCYNEFIILRREYEKEYHQNENCPKTKEESASELTSTIEQLESTRIANDEKTEIDQLPDYSMYNDDVNASMLRVLQQEEEEEEEEGGEDEKKQQDETTIKKSPIVIEVSDDSTDSNELEVVQTIEPVIPKKTQPPATISPPLPAKNASPTSTRVLRHIVLDGQNIARNSNDYTGSFSWFRLANAITYFKNRGHDHVIAFLPLYLRDFTSKNLSISDANRERQIRGDLINSRYIAFTPSRYNNGHRLVNYDDRFILQYAADNDGVVVSNDNFRDLQHEKSFQFIINNRILPFATINDTFMPATDPLGRNGPNLDEFLSKNISPLNHHF